MSAIRGVNGGEDDFISLTLCSAVTQEQSGALSLVEIVEILCSHWLNLSMLAPRYMP